MRQLGGRFESILFRCCSSEYRLFRPTERNRRRTAAMAQSRTNGGPEEVGGVRRLWKEPSMLTRREMVCSTMAFAAWPMLRAGTAKTIPVDSKAGANDEEYWGQVRSQFEWEAESTNLDTVVRGISTKHVRELATARATDLNSIDPRKVVTR